MTAESFINWQEPLLSKSQLGWLNKARAFAQSIPRADIIKADKESIFRRDLFEAACQEGFGALPFPSIYGGSGGDYLSFCLVNEEFGRRLTPIMSSLGVHVLCQEPIYRFGDDGQKKKYLPPSSKGKYLGAFGLTEPGAGSDTAALKTSAKLVGNEFILNGTKIFITSGGAADYFIVMAKVEGQESLSGSKSITSFIVEKDFAGLAVGQKFDLLGMRGYATCEIVFNDCRVPKENLLGELGGGRKVALSSLAKGRVTIASQCLGWAEGALDAINNDLQKKQQDLIGLSYSLGDLICEVEAARALTYQAASAIDRGQGNVMLASMAKVKASDVAERASSQAMSIVGSSSLTEDLFLERIFRDAKAGPIYEGTNQIQRLLIARNLLK